MLSLIISQIGKNRGSGENPCSDFSLSYVRLHKLSSLYCYARTEYGQRKHLQGRWKADAWRCIESKEQKVR